MELDASCTLLVAGLVCCGLIWWIFSPAIDYFRSFDLKSEQNILTFNKGGAAVVDSEASIENNASVYLSVIVPAYNEEERLPSMLESALSFLHSKRWGRSFEVIVVDDGSSDNTASTVQHYMLKDTAVRLLCLSQNVGKGGAVRRGVQRARGQPAEKAHQQV